MWRDRKLFLLAMLWAIAALFERCAQWMVTNEKQAGTWVADAESAYPKDMPQSFEDMASDLRRWIEVLINSDVSGIQSYEVAKAARQHIMREIMDDVD